MALMVGEGRDFPDWRLKQLAEAKDMPELVKELESSPYGEAVKGAAASTLNALLIERELERAFLKAVSEINTEHSLTVGPAVKYFASKEYELSNLKALLQRIAAGLPQDFVEPLLTVEG